MVFTAPAKINLYLKVIGKRDDGYHEIETLFERISIFDRLFIEKIPGPTTITCKDPRVPQDKDSLLARTLQLFKERSGIDTHFRIFLEKNIPIGAGLGGGSSDAATLLKALNQITGTPLGQEDQEDICRALGADIMFFLKDYSFGFGSGRGDIVQKAETSFDLWHILVNPGFEVSTADVYAGLSDFNLTKNKPVDKLFTAFLKDKNAAGLADNFHNDLQAIVLRDFPVLRQVCSELKNAGAKGVLLSGSGPTIFGIFDKKEIKKAESRIQQIFPPEKNWQVYIARTY